MKGANQYASIFGNERCGKLRFVSGSHARGPTFHVYATVADGKEIEVYGITGGQPGWTETYGWLHKGKWQEDFAKAVEARHAWIAERAAAQEKAAAAKAETDRGRVDALLSEY